MLRQKQDPPVLPLRFVPPFVEARPIDDDGRNLRVVEVEHELRIDKSEGGEERIFVGGGFMEVLPDRVTVLADIAEHSDEINLERAEAARHAIAERLAGEVPDTERRTLEQELVMAEERLRLARIRRGGGG